MTELVQESLAGDSWQLLNMQMLQAEIGGVVASLEQISEALVCLTATRVPMIRRPLQQIGNPLHACDYHSVAAPYRKQFLHLEAQGRGTQARHLTKLAFCHVLTITLEMVGTKPVLGFLPLLDDAYIAFGNDYTYSAAMAKAAVAIRNKRQGRRAA